MPAGLISIDIEARLAKLEEGVGRANKNLDGFGKKVDSVAARAKNVFAGMAAGLVAAFSVGALVSMTKNIIANAEALQDLSDATGSSVEALSRLNNITQIGGGNFEEIKGALERLAAGMAGVEEGGSKTADALRFLNIQAKDPAAALEEIALKLNKFSDGASKAAIAKDLFGRAGVGFLATLKDIANNGDVAATVLTKQAEAASKLAEAIRKLEVQSTTLSNALLSVVVPALNAVVERMNVAAGAAGSFGQGLEAMLSVNIRPGAIADQLDQVRESLARLKAEAREGKFELIPGSRDEAINSLEAQLAIILRARQQRALAQAVFSPDDVNVRDRLMLRKPELGYTGNKSSASPAATAKLDEFAKAIERISKLAAEADLELQGMFSTQEITGAQKALAALTSSDEWQKFTQPQRDALQARYQMIDAVQRETIEWKRKREETEKEIQALKQLDEEQARAVQAFTATIGQYADENSAMERSIALIGQDDASRQKFNETLRREQLIKEGLLARDESGLAILDEQYQRRLKLIDVIAEQTKRLEEVQKFTDIGAQSFSAFLQDLTRGNPLDALKKLAENFSSRITSVVADSLSQKLFSKDGALGGFGEFFADLFGGGKDAAGAAALTGSASALTASGTVLTTAGASLNAAAAALMASAGVSSASSSAGGIFGALGNIFSGSGGGGGEILTGLQGFATGTDFVPRTGLALIHRGERITPAAHNRSRGGRTSVTNTTIHLTVPPGANYQTARQAAKMAADAASSARRRG